MHINIRVTTNNAHDIFMNKYTFTKSKPRITRLQIAIARSANPGFTIMNPRTAPDGVNHEHEPNGLGSHP